MEKDKLLKLIELLECEVEEICDIPKVGHRASVAFCLIKHIKDVIQNEKEIDLEKVLDELAFFSVLKEMDDKEINKIKDDTIKDLKDNDLDRMATKLVEKIILHDRTVDELPTQEEFDAMKKYYKYLIKNGLIGQPIQTVEYKGYHATQHSNFKIHLSDGKDKEYYCTYHKKATKQELKNLIDRLISGNQCTFSRENIV